MSILKTNISPEREWLSKACGDDGISLKQIFAIKVLERSKLLGVYFHSSQPYCEICENDFYVPRWKVETCYNLVLQFMIFCIFTYIPFSVNKSNFHRKRRSRISTNSFKKISVSISKSGNSSFFWNFRGFSLDNLECNDELNWNTLYEN